MDKSKRKNFEIVTSLDSLSEEQIIKALHMVDENNVNHLINYAYILHDKDVDRDGTKKYSHWHILIKMDNAYNFEYIANRFGVKINFVENIKTTFPKALNYLTHNNEKARNENKFLYDDEDVKSNYCWKNERDIAIKQEKKKNRLNEIISLIDNGTIRKFNYFNYITMEEYTKYKKQIDLAFNYRIDRIKGSNRNMEVIFINGTSGSGKTTYAKMYAQQKGYSIYVSSGSNDVLDDYGGEDCIILDDLRPSVMGLSDLLKMLDNHTQSSIKSRYKNKVIECKLIIITSILDIDTFFKKVFSEEVEPIKQLMRRCKTKIRIDDDYIYVQLFDECKEKYGKEIKYKNTIRGLYKKETFLSDEDYEEATKIFDLKIDENESKED